MEYGIQNNISVVAEGVETAEEVNKLSELDAQYGQGYFFVKPMTERDLNDIINDWRMPDVA